MKLLGNGPSLRVGKPPSPMAIYLFGLAYRQTRILNHSKHARKVGAFVHHTISVPKQPSRSRRYFLNPFADQRCHFRVPTWHSVRNQSCIRALAQLLQEQDYCSISLCATFKEVTRIIRWQSTRGAKWKLAFSVLVPSEGLSPCLLRSLKFIPSAAAFGGRLVGFRVRFEWLFWKQRHNKGISRPLVPSGSLYCCRHHTRIAVQLVDGSALSEDKSGIQ